MEKVANKVNEQLELWCSAQNMTFVSQKAKDDYKKRTRRIADAIQLKKPDRVPIVPMWEYFYATYANESCHDVIYDIEIAKLAIKKTITELEPDAFEAPIFFGTGPVYDAIDFKQVIWPGHGITRDKGHQFVETEYMKSDEYDELISDPSDYMMRKFLPRICGNFKAFEAFQPFRNLFAYFTMYAGFFGLHTPQAAEAMQKLLEAGKASFDYVSFLASTNKEMQELGFPCWSGALAEAPFDGLSDTMRGTHGTSIDMYRQPDNVKEACEVFARIFLEMAISTAKLNRIPIVFMPLHKGTALSRDGKGGFMSLKQFEEFYWPTLKKVMMGLIDEGLVPNLLIEGDYTSRLDIIKDVPKGTCIYHFEDVDLHKAKEILGDHVCIRGSVPMKVMALGTTQDVRDYCKQLIDILGEGGGFIMDASMASEDVKPENMRAMIEFTKEYGVYR